MLVLPFHDIDRTLLPVVGGKAGNLGELTRAGFPVPPGFCLTTEAYGMVARAAGLAGIVEAISRTAAADVAALTALAARARQALLATAIPAGISQQILQGYGRLGDTAPVAVRSSATAEDLPFASFAGQQDTYLNIVGETALLDAVRRCWASLWTDRAVVYRATNGIDSHTVRLAVAVQRMVDAAVAGVMFTANPVTGRRHEAVIDAGPGLGEAVVSGAVNPDHFVVDPSGGRIVRRRLGDKRLVIRPVPGGGTSREELPPGGQTACLTDEQVLELAALGARVEDYYAAPQDTEWAVDGSGALWLTQARPITTLYPLPARGSGRTSERVYFSFNVAQGLYRPITPMGIAAFGVIASALARLFGFKVTDNSVGPNVFAPAGQRVFLDVTTAVRSSVGRVIIPRILGVMEARSAAVMRHLFADERFSVTIRSKLPFLRHVGPVALRYHMPLRLIGALLRPEAARRKVRRIGRELDASLDPGPLGSGRQRIDWVETTLADRTAPLLPRLLPVAGAGFVALFLADRLLGDDARVGEVQPVLRGIPHNVTTEMDLELWRLAATLREVDPAQLAERHRAGTLPPRAHHGIADFLARYGHRAVAEIDIGMPRWSDDPSHILGVLANYLRSDSAADTAADAVFARGAAEAEATVRELASRAAKRSKSRGRLVRGLLHRTRGLVGLRELPKFYLVRIIAACRAQLRLAGEELAAQGSIAEPDDIFFLDLVQAREAVTGKDMKDLVAQRRRAYDDELRRRHIPRVLLSDGTEPEVELHSQASTGLDGTSASAGFCGTPASTGLHGTPASAGVATGTARVILDPVGAHLEPGEILVAPSTDPGWTPLFLTAGGLVMEMGGANSHGAVVAREYGIPAVVGVPNATTVITSGSRVVIDGTSGSVSLPT